MIEGVWFLLVTTGRHRVGGFKSQLEALELLPADILVLQVELLERWAFEIGQFSFHEKVAKGFQS